MRKKERWFNVIPELKEYTRFCQVKNTQTPAISPINCPDYNKVVEAIERAEAKRQR
jgi:hypothetical protein